MSGKLNCLLLLCLLACAGAWANSPDWEIGDPLLKVYTPDDYGGAGVNWVVAQRPDGLMFLGNGDGLFSFDGSTWRHHPMPADGPIHTLAWHPDSRLYVGTVGEIGYFEPGENGQLHYTSLVGELDPSVRQFTDVDNVHVIGSRVFFNTLEYLYIYQPGHGFQSFQPDKFFNRAWVVDGRYYISELGALKHLEQGQLKRVTALDGLGITRFTFVLKQGDDLLVGTANKGIYRLRDGTAQPWLAADSPWAKLWLYAAVPVEHGLLAVATIRAGVLFFDAKAKLVYHLDKRRGLPIDTVLNLSLDRQGGLWLAQEGFVTRVRLPFDLSVYRATDYNTPRASSLVRFDGQMYVGSILGLYRLQRGPRMTPVAGTSNNVARMRGSPYGILLSGQSEFQLVHPGSGRVTDLLSTPQSVDMLVPSKHPDWLLMLLKESVQALQRIPGKQAWGKPQVLYSNEVIQSRWVEDRNGILWCGTEAGTLLRVDFEQDRWQVHSFSIQAGLKRYAPLFLLDGRLVVSLESGLYHWDLQHQRLGQPVAWYRSLFGAKAQGPEFLYQDAEGRVWMEQNDQVGHARRETSGHWAWQTYPLANTGFRDLLSAYPDGKVLWLGFDRGIVRLRPGRATPPPRPLILRELAYRDAEQPLWQGNFSQRSAFTDLDPEQGAIRLSYSLLDYDSSTPPRYRYRLDNTAWSKWSKDSYVDFGGLSGGQHRLVLEALNQLGQTSAADVSLGIAVPWYLNGWALAGYALAFLLLIHALVRVAVARRTRVLRRQQDRLERLVAQRTAKVKQQADELRQMNEAKTRFFSNVSHEFRTPLTLTMGPLEDLLRLPEPLTPGIRRYVEMALNNAHRMLGLLGQILDVNRLEAGRMPLRVHEYDLADLLRNAMQRFLPAAKKQGVALAGSGLDDPVLLYFDADQVEKMINNLLSNALKFTPAGGQVTVSLEGGKRSVRFAVSDSGQGIAKADRKRVFERYFQSAENRNDQQPGTGIGLALVKEMVQLHHGKIHLHSARGQGTRVEIELKRGYRHFSAGEILSEKPELQTPAPVQDSGEVLIAAPSAGMKTLLVVDDNRELREFMRMSLTASFRVIEAADGVAGLEKMLAEQPDVVVSDIMMPRMDGFTLVEKVKSNPEIAHIPVLLLTAKSTKRDTVKGLRRGADDYLTKPFDSSELIARILALIAQNQHVAEKIRRENPFRAPAVDASLNDHSQRFLDRLHARLAENLFDRQLTVEALAAALNISHSTLTRRIKRHYGCSPRDFIRDQRLSAARGLLAKRKGSVTEIAYAVGFDSLCYFSRAFARQYGQAPSSVLHAANQ